MPPIPNKSIYKQLSIGLSERSIHNIMSRMAFCFYRIIKIAKKTLTFQQKYETNTRKENNANYKHMLDETHSIYFNNSKFTLST